MMSITDSPLSNHIACTGAFPRLGRIALRLGIRYFDIIVCGNRRHTPPFSHPLPNMISCFVSTKNLSFRQANNSEHRRTGFLTGFTSFLKLVKHGRIRTDTWAAHHRLLIYLKLHASLKLARRRESHPPSLGDFGIYDGSL